MKKLDKNLAIKAQLTCIDLINNFCSLVSDYEESLEETYERFVGFPLSKKGYNPCELFEIADMYLNLSDVFNFYILGCTVDEFIGWYWWNIEQIQDNKTGMNLKHWLIINKFDK